MKVNLLQLQSIVGARAFTIYHSLMLLQQRQPKNPILVETGCARIENNYMGDGLSTIFLGSHSANCGGKTFTCDISEQNLQECKKITSQIKDHIEYIQEDSIQFLKAFDRPIDYLYLDSMDFVTSGDPIPPQEHVVKEYEAAKDKLHDNSILLIDDCFLIHGGKGGKIIPLLLAEGWWIYASFYQTMLVRMSTIKA